MLGYWSRKKRQWVNKLVLQKSMVFVHISSFSYQGLLLVHLLIRKGATSVGLLAGPAAELAIKRSVTRSAPRLLAKEGKLWRLQHVMLGGAFFFLCFFEDGCWKSS